MFQDWGGRSMACPRAERSKEARWRNGGWTVSKVQEPTASCKLRSVNLIFTATESF